MEEKRRQELVGKVVSAGNDKTITVLVETYRNDRLYGKRVKYSKKYAAHDEKNLAQQGDTVRRRAAYQHARFLQHQGNHTRYGTRPQNHKILYRTRKGRTS